ncbi:MAG: ornithine carbamoyltransferase [Candidatus Aenigmarchaeota archaeon]|nr:ornithine carbamoyltransferase [Candidatus Aenigmarchaeota archaeon]
MLSGSDFLSVQDLEKREVLELFRRAAAFKRKPLGTCLRHKTIAMLFAKPSTRTRVSFEVAISHLGGRDIYLSAGDLQVSRGESLGDTARVLSRYVDGIVARLFKHEDLLALAEYAAIPVINGLTDLLHPCQALADLFTIQETFRKLRGIRVAYIGDGNNNVTHSLMHACTLLGVDLTIACPDGYQPLERVSREALQNARSSGAELRIVQDPREAVKGADVVYTDTWVSMGEEAEAREREQAFRGYQVNSRLLGYARKQVKVMHDLPAHRGKEITSEVMDGPASLIFQQAENRLHVEKALLSLIYG